MSPQTAEFIDNPPAADNLTFQSWYCRKLGRFLGKPSQTAGLDERPRRFKCTDGHRLELNGVSHEIPTEVFTIRFARVPSGD
jgi:hypothetical protein